VNHQYTLKHICFQIWTRIRFVKSSEDADTKFHQYPLLHVCRWKQISKCFCALSCIKNQLLSLWHVGCNV